MLSLGLDASGSDHARLSWESYEAILWPPCFSSKGVCHMTNDMPREKRSRDGLNYMFSDMLGEKR